MARQPEDTMTRDLFFFSSHRSKDGSLTEVGHTLMLSATRSGMGVGMGVTFPAALSVEALHTLLGNTRVARASHHDANEDAGGDGS